MSDFCYRFWVFFFFFRIVPINSKYQLYRVLQWFMIKCLKHFYITACNATCIFNNLHSLGLIWTTSCYLSSDKLRDVWKKWEDLFISMLLRRNFFQKLNLKISESYRLRLEWHGLCIIKWQQQPGFILCQSCGKLGTLFVILKRK